MLTGRRVFQKYACRFDCTLPVLVSGLRSSRVLPLETMISCSLDPEKLPWTEWVMPVALCRVKL